MIYGSVRRGKNVLECRESTVVTWFVCCLNRFRFRKMASAMLKSTVTIVAAVLSMAVLANAQAPSPAPGPEKGAGVLTVPTMIVPVVGMILSLVAGRMLC